MDAELKRKWVEALRSGKYQQGRGQLRHLDGDKFCCLGVLCDVVPGAAWNEDIATYKGSRDWANLPVALQLVSHISDEDEERLTVMNDKQDMSFAEIADYIEAHL